MNYTKDGVEIVYPETVEMKDIFIDEPNFTNWLFLPDNLGVLSDLIGYKIKGVTPEYTIGLYSLDIYGSIEDQDIYVYIENQFTDDRTNYHSHIGQIITYLFSNKSDEGKQKIALWITQYYKDQHEDVFRNLNKYTTNGIDFYLIKVTGKKMKIDSKEVYYPEYQIIVKPDIDDKIEAERISIKETESKVLYRDFMYKFADYIDTNKISISKVSEKTSSFSWKELKKFKGISIRLLLSKEKISLQYIVKEDEDSYKKLYVKKEDINKRAGVENEYYWPSEDTKDKKDYLFPTFSHDFKITEKDKWNDMFQWIYKIFNIMKTIIEEL